MNSPIKNEYSIREKFQLGWWLLKTKLLNPKARLQSEGGGTST